MMKSKENEHQCKKITHYYNDEDTYLRIKCFNGKWVLHHFHFACDKCVYDGEAQYEGEIMIVCDVAINYCPYCGTLLNTKISSIAESEQRVNDDQNHLCLQLEEYNNKFPHVGFSFDTDAVWKISKEFECWSLERHSVATERMVLAEEADKDELVFWNGIAIDYCPFCGIKLQIS